MLKNSGLKIIYKGPSNLASDRAYCVLIIKSLVLNNVSQILTFNLFLLFSWGVVLLLQALIVQVGKKLWPSCDTEYLNIWF